MPLLVRKTCLPLFRLFTWILWCSDWLKLLGDWQLQTGHYRFYCTSAGKEIWRCHGIDEDACNALQTFNDKLSKKSHYYYFLKQIFVHAGRFANLLAGHVMVCLTQMFAEWFSWLFFSQNCLSTVCLLHVNKFKLSCFKCVGTQLVSESCMCVCE